MNMLPLLFALMIGQRKGADRQKAMRAGLLGSLLPMPAGLIVAAVSARPSPREGEDTGEPPPKTVGDARRAVGRAFDAYIADTRARDAEKANAEITEKAQSIVDGLRPEQDQQALQPSRKGQDAS
jgi:predicted component of type VI protein secretion system